MSVRPALSLNARKQLWTQATRAALETRVRLKVPAGEAVSVYDAAERLGVEVRFLNAPSLEGLYLRQAPGQAVPLIALSSMRPAGRQVWTAAHELGHHVFGHGDRTDDADLARQEESNDPEEVLAHSFAATFLMPKAAVERGFRVRGFALSSPTPAQVFTVAGWLGVGYTTLINHMLWTLRLIPETTAKALLTRQPKKIRAEMAGQAVTGDLWIVNGHWTGRPVDARVGDVLLVPERTEVTGEVLSAWDGPAGMMTVDVVSPGIGQVIGDGWAVFVRCSKREYRGRARFRHVEPDDDEA
ncbi:MAG: ImmA/IrrE family metallo-endopeptidase [Longimicrobiaceae bacterium]